MGLDQYGFAYKGEALIDEDGFLYYEDNIELETWRKHPNLQGWMKELYHEKGGEDDFNCEVVVLDSEDLDRLESALDKNELPDTVGFFFGSNANDFYSEKDREFIRKASAAIKQGYTVAYDSSW